MEPRNVDRAWHTVRAKAVLAWPRLHDLRHACATFLLGAAPVFLISLKADGFRLNLTGADYCILLDPWWNPATSYGGDDGVAVRMVHRPTHKSSFRPAWGAGGAGADS